MEYHSFKVLDTNILPISCLFSQGLSDQTGLIANHLTLKKKNCQSQNDNSLTFTDCLFASENFVFRIFNEI